MLVLGWYNIVFQEFKAGGDVNGLVDILKQVQAGQVVADYQSKGGRKSLDRRDSINR